METQIIETEWKVGKESGRKYLRVKTQNGWMSCFEEEIIDKIQENVGKSLNLEIVETGNGFKNIRGIMEVAEIKPDQMGKMQEIQGKAKPYMNSDDKPSFYVSYAKDLIVAGMKPDEAIAVIKNLRKEFS